MSASAYTTFRAALQATLAAGLSGYAWNAGPPPSSGAVPNSSPLGYVWVDRSDTDPQNQLLETITCGVRMYVEWSQRVDPQTPIDPTALEQAAEDLQTTLAPTQYGSDPWYFTVWSIKFDNDNGWIEADVRGVRWNDSAVS